MREPRFLVRDDLARRFSGDRRVALGPDAARHAATVLRLRAGAPLRVFDGGGAEYRAKLVAAGGGHAEAELLERLPEDAGAAALPIILALGVARGQRMDLSIQKSVELGVARIAPLWTARGVVQPDRRGSGEERVRRWLRIAEGACEQCGRRTVPAIDPPRTLDEWLDERARRPEGEGAAIRLDPEAGPGFASLPPPRPPLTLLVGPEGGLDPHEAARADAAGFAAARLGPRTLRAETAAIAAVAAAQLLWGDLG